MKTKPNHPINPIFGDSGFATSVSNSSENDATGLTKREYFAALAMQGFSAGVFSNERVAIKLLEVSDECDIDPQKYIVGMALETADALIEELNKSQS